MPLPYGHTPVLLREVIFVLRPVSGERVLDCTLGLGGHSEAILASIRPDGLLVGLDADKKNLCSARERLSSFGDRCTFYHENFRNLAKLNLGSFDCILADLGLSSPHIDDPSRGFSWKSDGPLDMRYHRDFGLTAAALIEKLSDAKLAEVLRMYGELPRSWKLAAALKAELPQTTKELSRICTNVYSYRTPAVIAQVFQALRIAVNDEMGSLDLLLQNAPMLLRPGGRLGIITFHSLEDRAVKVHFRNLTTVPIDERTGSPVAPPSWELLTKKPVSSSAEEIAVNPRSRSAKFRVVRRLP